MNTRDRGILFEALARWVDAGWSGASLAKALRGLSAATGRTRRGERRAAAIKRIAAAIEAGTSLGEALEAAGLPAAQVLAIAHAERVGRAPELLRELAADEARQAAARRTLVARAVYPVFLVHFAAVAPNAGLLLTDFAAGLGHVAAVLVPLDAALLAVVWFATRGVRTDAGARFVLSLPELGRLAALRAESAFLRALHRLYEAGVALPRAAHEAATALDNAVLRDRFVAAVAPLEKGEPFAVALAALPAPLPEMHAVLAAAEPVGELGDALRRASDLSGEEADLLERRLVKFTSGALYALAIFYVAFRVFAFYAATFQTLSRF